MVYYEAVGNKNILLVQSYENIRIPSNLPPYGSTGQGKDKLGLQRPKS